MSKKIEFACTHNNGRSPLAEAFAIEYIRDKGIEGYGISSSGTRADEINGFLAGTYELPDKDLRVIAQLGLERSFVSDLKNIEKLLQNDNLSPEDIEGLTQYARQTARTLVSEESQYRDIAFGKFGLALPKAINRQTIVRPDRGLLLGMGQSNVREAESIYSGSGNQPVIETLAGYAERNSGLEFKSGFGGDLKDYLAMAEEIRDYTQKSLDRAIQEI
jgi:hypothetical protein|tara:strand:- start:3103 stop:3756 length:654 start_codon:yes stop_codon:yes gene_type:complete